MVIYQRKSEYVLNLNIIIIINFFLVTSSWRDSGLLPLNKDKVVCWCVEKVTNHADILIDFIRIRQICADVPLGTEAEKMNQIFNIVTKTAPIYKVLYDHSFDDETCTLCNRKLKKSKPLAVVYKGCRMTSPEMRTLVQEAQIEKERKEILKQEKDNKKKLKDYHRNLASTQPLSNLFDASVLTAKELQEVLIKRNISFKKTTRKADLISKVVESNKV